jgi:hypothetical protein
MSSTLTRRQLVGAGGAGLSGLAAACALVAADRTVIVLGILLGFVGGSAYQRRASLPAGQRRAQVLASFAGFVGDQAGAPVAHTPPMDGAVPAGQRAAREVIAAH